MEIISSSEGAREFEEDSGDGSVLLAAALEAACVSMLRWADGREDMGEYKSCEGSRQGNE